MITDQDIKKLTDYQKEVFKDVFFTKEDGQRLEEKIDKVQTTVDVLVKDVKDLKQEKTVLNHCMKKTEDWIDQASPKLGLEFKH